MLAYEEELDDPIFNDLSNEVYRHAIKCVVPDVTDEKINTIVQRDPNDNPLSYVEIIPAILNADEIPKEDVRQFYVNTADRVIGSKDPIG